jgi:hypothetical protein
VSFLLLNSVLDAVMAMVMLGERERSSSSGQVNVVCARRDGWNLGEGRL